MIRRRVSPQKGNEPNTNANPNWDTVKQSGWTPSERWLGRRVLGGGNVRLRAAEAGRGAREVWPMAVGLRAEGGPLGMGGRKPCLFWNERRGRPNGQMNNTANAASGLSDERDHVHLGEKWLARQPWVTLSHFYPKREIISHFRRERLSNCQPCGN